MRAYKQRGLYEGGGAYTWGKKGIQNKLHTPTVVGLIKICFEFTVAFLSFRV